MKNLPTNPATISDALPLAPGVVRSTDGELKIDGSGEQRSALVINQTDVTDPATGKFGQTIPVDSNRDRKRFKYALPGSIRAVSQMEWSRWRRGEAAEKWHAELNDPFPDLRVRSWHLRGIRNETPHGVVGGPIVRNKLYINTALQYFFQRDVSRTLPFPRNESKRESINSFTQLDWVISPKQIVTATFHFSPQHINFVNPDFFSPQPVTPSFAQHNYVGTAADHYGLFGGILDSSLSFQRFDAVIGSQGTADMILTPIGNSGNYFGTQNRDSRRVEWLETWSPVPLRFLGSHLIKLGSSYTSSGVDGQFTYRPVDIENAAGLLLQRIDFDQRSPFSRTDLEVTGFLQDHWAVNSKLAFDYGARMEHQQLPQSLRIAPRAGLAWTPFEGDRTVFRAGYGQYYDHIPLDVYTFGRYPNRTITNYAPDGSVIGQPIDYINVIGSITGPRSFLIHGQQVAGAFSPRGNTWNLQVEHVFSRLFRARAVYTDNRSVGLIVVEPAVLGNMNEIVLNGDGSSRFRQLELTGKFTWKDGQQMNLSYTHSRAEGSLNGFDSFLGNFPTPVIRPNVYSNLPGDIPNRFVMWGRVHVPMGNFFIQPIVEYRNGFPYAQLDLLQNYVGVPYRDSTRFPNFFSADARFIRDFKVNPKYTLRLSLTSFNMTNHFNALAIHSNINDPQSGGFFGNYHRRYRGDFEVVF